MFIGPRFLLKKFVSCYKPHCHDRHLLTVDNSTDTLLYLPVCCWEGAVLLLGTGLWESHLYTCKEGCLRTKNKLIIRVFALNRRLKYHEGMKAISPWCTDLRLISLNSVFAIFFIALMKTAVSNQKFSSTFTTILIYILTKTNFYWSVMNPVHLNHVYWSREQHQNRLVLTCFNLQI